MKHSICVFIVGSVLASLAQSAYGQCAGPTSVSVGDPTGSCNLGNLETAVGYSVLYNNIANVGGGGFDTAIGAFALSSNTTGTYNTASGAYVLYGNTAGTYNTASGVYALYSNTTGGDNTASGAYALYSNMTGAQNTASGYHALYYNSTGTANTAIGVDALQTNRIGNYNTAVGYSALLTNYTGNYNSALGYQALGGPGLYSTGSYTTAVGAFALTSNATGSYDTAFGAYALIANTAGSNNTAFGYAALRSTTTGSNNIGFGFQSLYSGTTGSNNIAMGYQAAYLTDGSNNIEIGSKGAIEDDGIIRIGTQGTQTEAYIAGINNTHLTGSAVYVTSSGQLGVLASSERYKTAIAPLGKETEKLQQLRPVSFHLKTDPKGDVQYGLIAEEVDKVYPELVIRDDKGNIEGVRYDELAPMLLNEMQKERATIEAQNQKIASLEQQLAGIQVALATLQSKDQLVAQR